MPSTPKVVKMDGRITMLSAPRPISASGKPSEEPIQAVMERPAAGHYLPQQFLSEYERSFRPFEKYHYENGSWILRKQINDSPREWLGELRDNRQRALENKARSRGDHFSSDHLLQIPSSATAFWEPLNSLPPLTDGDVELSPRRPATSGNELRNSAMTYRRPDTAPSLVRGGDPMETIYCGSNGLHSRRLESTAVQTGEPGTTSHRPASVSQATQTQTNFDQGSSTLARNDRLEVSRDHLTAEESAFRVRPTQSPDRTRLEILRRAKYFDAKDVAPSPAVLPRSVSMRSLVSGTGGGDRGSTYHSVPPARDRRPRSSIAAGDVSSHARHPRALSESQPRLSHTLPARNFVTLERLPGFSTPALASHNGHESRGSVGKENREISQGDHIAANFSTPSRKFPPASVFTVSPPQRRTTPHRRPNGVTTAEKDLARTGQTWNLSPPDRRPLGQSLKACMVGKNVPLSSERGTLRRGQSKEQFSAWIDL